MYKQSKQSKLINNLIAENKIITIQIVFMFKNFCCCNAIISDLYDGKSKNKTAVIFFSNSLVVLQKSIMTAFNLLYIVGTPPLLKGGGQDLQKFESPGGVPLFYYFNVQLHLLCVARKSKVSFITFWFFSLLN